MARLRDIEGRTIDEARTGAYGRCFGNAELSRLISRVQSLIIRNGLELEKLVTGCISPLLIDDLDDFLDAQIMQSGVRVAVKPAIKKAQKMQGRLIEPDFLIFERKGTSQNCYIVELKDGHEFDTKSSAKEQANLNQFLSMNAMALQFFQSYIKVCGFNAQTREEIHTGFKNKIDISQAMTGREFCQILGIDYEDILTLRAQDREANYSAFLDDLMAMPDVRAELAKRLNG